MNMITAGSRAPPDGAKRWRLAYRQGPKQKVLALGVYPALGLRQAREAREEARRLLAAGKDPSVARKVAKAYTAEATKTSARAVATEVDGVLASAYAKLACATAIPPFFVVFGGAPRWLMYLSGALALLMMGLIFWQKRSNRSDLLWLAIFGLSGVLFSYITAR